MGWTRYTTSGRPGRDRPIDRVELGPGDVAGLERRLLGGFDGKRVLELGTGAGSSAVAMAAAGARVVAIDSDEQELARAHVVAAEADVRVELHHAELNELAFLHADIFDLVLSVHSLAAVDDLGRVFRQAYRVLKPDHPMVLTMPHPSRFPDDRDRTGKPLGRKPHVTHRHSISHVFTMLTRADFRVDTLLEPEDDDGRPLSVVLRARKVAT